MEDKNRNIYVIEWGQTVVYIDNNEEIEISVGVSCYYTGHGIATKAVKEIVGDILLTEENKSVIAYVREDNTKSQSVFVNSGLKD